MRRHPPHHLSPVRANHPAGQDPEAGFLPPPGTYSNAPIRPECQSILSKIVALTPIEVDLRISAATMVGARPLGRFGSPMSDPSNPRMGFFPFKDRGFETFIRRDLIVRVRFLASLTFFRLVKTSTAAEK